MGTTRQYGVRRPGGEWIDARQCAASSQQNYTHALVQRGDAGREVVVSFHNSEPNARKAASSAHIPVDVLPVEAIDARTYREIKERAELMVLPTRAGKARRKATELRARAVAVELAALDPANIRTHPRFADWREVHLPDGSKRNLGSATVAEVVAIDQKEAGWHDAFAAKAEAKLATLAKKYAPGAQPGDLPVKKPS